MECWKRLDRTTRCMFLDRYDATWSKGTGKSRIPILSQTRAAKVFERGAALTPKGIERFVPRQTARPQFLSNIFIGSSGGLRIYVLGITVWKSWRHLLLRWGKNAWLSDAFPPTSECMCFAEPSLPYPWRMWMKYHKQNSGPQAQIGPNLYFFSLHNSHTASSRLNRSVTTS